MADPLCRLSHRVCELDQAQGVPVWPASSASRWRSRSRASLSKGTAPSYSMTRFTVGYARSTLASRKRLVRRQPRLDQPGSQRGLHRRLGLGIGRRYPPNVTYRADCRGRFAEMYNRPLRTMIKGEPRTSRRQMGFGVRGLRAGARTERERFSAARRSAFAAPAAGLVGATERARAPPLAPLVARPDEVPACRRERLEHRRVVAHSAAASNLRSMAAFSPGVADRSNAGPAGSELW